MRINLIISLLLFNVTCMGDTDIGMNDVFQLLSSQPKEQQQKDYERGIERIHNCLTNMVSPGRATYGSTAILAASLGIEEDFENHIERWFQDYADIDPHITDYIYELKEPEEWSTLFKKTYPKLTNPKVLYRMRFYAFSENYVLPQTDSRSPNLQYKGLEIQLEPVDSESFEEFKLKITNTSKHDIFVFPQTEEVATSWSRKDGVPLPNKTSSKYGAEKSTGLFFIFPGDSLHRQLNLKAVERNKTFYRSSDVIFLENKHNFTCINGVYLAMDQEALSVEMKAYLVPFSPSTGKTLQSDLKSKFGHKASLIHVIQEPLFSNPIDLVVQQGAILGLKSK